MKKNRLLKTFSITIVTLLFYILKSYYENRICKLKN